MHTHVIGFRPPDAKWKKMKEVHDACIAANVEIPEEVDEFFNWEPPDPRGVKVELEDEKEPTFPITRINGGGFVEAVPPRNTPKKKKLGAVVEWKEDMREGFEVDVTKLPVGVTIVRFYNSY